MCPSERDVAEFLVNNKDEVNAYLQKALTPFAHASLLFKNHPDLCDEFIERKTVSLLHHYLLEHFPELNYETISLYITEKNVKIYL